MPAEFGDQLEAVGEGRVGGAELREVWGRSGRACGSLSGLGGGRSHWRWEPAAVQRRTTGLRAEGGKRVRRPPQASRQEIMATRIRVARGGVRSNGILDYSEHGPDRICHGLCSSELLLSNKQTQNLAP